MAQACARALGRAASAARLGRARRGRGASGSAAASAGGAGGGAGADTAEELAANKCFGGVQRRVALESSALGCRTTLSVYEPPQAAGGRVPVVYWLSGLTCDDTNFVFKAGAQRAAARLGVALVCPDTSPRGVGVEGEAESWDFGVAAGFYVDATTPKWAKHWNTRTYVEQELPEVLKQLYGSWMDVDTASISGHSMGGHGALTVGLRNAHKPYRSISAFAPIVNPSAPDCPWGQKAFAGYLGEQDKEAWKQYDACELLRAYSGTPMPILVDTGDADTFLEAQLKPERLVAAAEASGNAATVRMQPGYDHSYYFIATFIEEHLEFHAKHLFP